MATYHQIKPSIWDDPDFLEYPADKKLFFVYLFTNKAVTESGIYTISAKTIAYQTGISDQRIQELLDNTKNILYDNENKCIFVKNLRKHKTTGGNEEWIYKSIKNSYIATSKSWLWEEFIKEYPKYKTILSNGHIPEEPIDKGITKPIREPFIEPIDKGITKPIGKQNGNPDTKDKPIDKPIDKPLIINKNTNININDNLSLLDNNKSPKGGESSPQNPYEGFKDTLLKSDKPISVLISAMKQFHHNMPQEDLKQLGDRIGSLYKNKYRPANKILLLQDIVTTSFKSIDGSHLDYLTSFRKKDDREFNKTIPHKEKPLKSLSEIEANE